MELNLKGRKVLVTGAGEGIGRAQALAFAEEGSRVSACARGRDRMDSLCDEMQGDGHLCLTADLSSAEQTRDLHDKVMDAFGGLDILVNNVGSIEPLGDFFELTDEDWEQSFKTNLMPTVRLSRCFVPSLKKSAAPRIINISSIAAARPGVVFPHYSAMKAALSNLTVSTATAEYLLAMKCLAMRLGPEFQDETDVRFLLRYLNVDDHEEACTILDRFYPIERYPRKTFAALEELLGVSELVTE